RGGAQRSAVRATAVATDEPLGTGEHLLRGAARKGQKKNAVGRNAAIDEMCDAINEGAGFSRSRSGDDEKRSVAVSRRLCLLGIQLGREIARLSGLDVSFARGIDDRAHAAPER